MVQIRTYAILLAISITLSLTCIAGFNALIDPYRFFDSPDIPGINQYRFKFFFFQLLSKPYAVRNQKPGAVILGVSRAGSSLTTEHPGWKGFTGYNFAIAGTNTYLLWRNFQHARASGNLKRVLIALDFYMYNIHHELGSPSTIQEYEERLAVTASNTPNVHFPARWFDDTMTSLLSFGTLRDSWGTLTGQSRIDAGTQSRVTLTSSGFGVSEVPPGMSQHEGFRLIENLYMSSMWFPDPDRKFALEDPKNPVRSVYLRNILADCYRDGIEVTLVFSPFHARLSESMRAVGIWNYFEKWKRDIIKLNEMEAARANRPPFPVWDFTGYNSVTTEAVPPLDDFKSRMHWHLDSTHVSKATGDAMQNRIWGLGGEVIEDFGRLVNSSNIDLHLAEINLARAAYVEKFPEDILEITKQARWSVLWRSRAAPALLSKPEQ